MSFPSANFAPGAPIHRMPNAELPTVADTPGASTVNAADKAATCMNLAGDAFMKNGVSRTAMQVFATKLGLLTSTYKGVQAHSKGEYAECLISMMKCASLMARARHSAAANTVEEAHSTWKSCRKGDYKAATVSAIKTGLNAACTFVPPFAVASTLAQIVMDSAPAFSQNMDFSIDPGI